MKRILMGTVLGVCLVLFFSCRNSKIPKIEYDRVYEPQTILAIGDSLTYGLRVDRDKTYPAVLQKVLNDNGYDNYTVINAGISGETTFGTVDRIQSVLQKHNPDIVILTIGANDILKNKNIVQSEKNIEQILEVLQKEEKKILLSRMDIPWIVARERAKPFREMYPRLATKYNVSMVPDFLAGVTARTKYNQQDQIHPNAEGYVRIVNDNVWPALLPLIGGE